MTQSALIATHSIHGVFKRSGAVSPLKTFCGIQCWPAKNTAIEADTSDGRRIDITDTLAAVTCGRCKKTDWFKP